MNSGLNTKQKKVKKVSELTEVILILKQRYRKTVERKMQEKILLHFDKEKGIIAKETGEIIVDIKNIYDDDYFENLKKEKEDTEGKDNTKKDEVDLNENDSYNEDDVNDDVEYDEMDDEDEEEEEVLVNTKNTNNNEQKKTK